MSGIEIHANVARTILDHDFLVPLPESGKFTALLLIGAACILGISTLRGIRLCGALGLLGPVIIAGCQVALHLRHIWCAGTLLTGFVVSGSIAGVGEYALVAAPLRGSPDRA
jgi:CHASE2 domain-containing sensor protein